MAARTDASLAALLLVQRLVRLEPAPLSDGELWRVLGHGDPARLLGLDAAEVTQLLGGDPVLGARVASRLEAATAVAFALEDWERRGLTVLTPLDDAYPERVRERLGSAAPGLLHVTGPPEHLATAGVAVVGSRDVSDEGSAAAESLARAVAAGGLTLISGGARGVDATAMSAAYEAGGVVVAVLAEGLERRIRRPETRQAVASGRVTLASPYAPTAGFSAGAAMARNKVVYALARTAVVVATAQGQGGTWEGATEALRRNLTDVAVWQGPGAGPGNAALADRGARSVSDPADVLTAPANLPGQLQFTV